MLCVVCCVVWAKETGQEVGLWIVANWQIMLIHDEEQDGIQETKKGPPTGLRGNLKGASVLAGWQSIITAKLSWSCVALRPLLALLLFWIFALVGVREAVAPWRPSIRSKDLDESSLLRSNPAAFLCSTQALLQIYIRH